MSDPAATIELARLADLRAAYDALRPRVEARTWPLAEVFGVEPEAAWGPPEVLAHVAEMLPFWLGELERVVDGSTAPVPFGRTADDDLRVGVIGRDRTLPVRVLFARVDGGLRDWADRVATMTAEDRAKVGVHPRLGEMAVDRFLERWVLGHGAEHVDQLEAILATPTS
jgi:hypothetical protein